MKGENIMQLHLIESDKIYKEILETPIEKRDEVFKQKLLYRLN